MRFDRDDIISRVSKDNKNNKAVLREDMSIIHNHNFGKTKSPPKIKPKSAKKQDLNDKYSIFNSTGKFSYVSLPDFAEKTVKNAQKKSMHNSKLLLRNKMNM